MSPEATAGFDPVDLAVLSSRFTAIVRSMSNTLIRTGRSVILNTGRDFSCCVVTAARRVPRRWPRASRCTCSAGPT